MSKFNIIITDHLAEEGYDILRKDPDVSFAVHVGIKNDELKKIIGGYDAIITRSRTAITPELLEETGKLKIIGRAGVGLDNVDVETAAQKGLIVMNTPTANTLATVELTFAMILSAARKIPAADVSVRAGEWDRERFMGVQLYNKTLGIVGMGRIGTSVAVRAEVFGMRVAVFDPYIKKDKVDGIDGIFCQTLEELLAMADILTLHAPLNAETKRMITKERIGLMKKGAILINCARGGLVDEQALADAVNSGHLFSAAVDVFGEEPPKNSPLTSSPNIFCTPHIGARTKEAQEGMAVIICREVLNALHGRPYKHAVK